MKAYDLEERPDWKDCTCADNLYGRIGYCPLHDVSRRRIPGVSIWNTISPITAVLVWGFILAFVGYFLFMYIRSFA